MKTDKQIKSFGVGVSETESSVLKFEYPFKVQNKMQAERTSVTISSRCGRTIKKNHYNDNDYYYPSKASIPVHKATPK
jgi:hypothetical protein